MDDLFNLSTRSPVVSGFLLFSLIPMTVMRFSTDPDVACPSLELERPKSGNIVKVLLSG